MLDIAAGLVLGLITLAGSWLALSYVVALIEFLGDLAKAPRAAAARADAGIPARAEALRA